ncbi:MAG TPA: adenylosuccinate synthetase [Verrucomicrobiae bacterium]|nr:adenylosuccinate synthetase [Verrucomicrobiae bacterium]
MAATRYASVLGLGFGDCGKGHFVDALTRQWRAHTVVRFNGGAQAGHNVVTPHAASNWPGRHHTCSQFGAGTFVAGVRTLLIDPMIVHPGALLAEAEALARSGVHDALLRIGIDGRCRVTTPFHQAAGRLRELLRGAAAHGTCGVGVGETVRHGLEYPDLVLRYADLQGTASGLLCRLQQIRETLLAEFSCREPLEHSADFEREMQMLRDDAAPARWLAAAQALARSCPPVSDELMEGQLKQPGCVLFEGAQGVLLDEWRGFHPHTTWSSINTEAIASVATRFNIDTGIEHLGVLRTYVTRHGAGPLPTHDPALDGALPEPHNTGHGRQGAFRRGHPDAVLLRYALDVIGGLSGLLISHLDVFQREISLKWCDSYAVNRPSPEAPSSVRRLPVGVSGDLDHQVSLTNFLQSARPEYDPTPVRSAAEFLNRVKGVTDLPVYFTSYGETCSDVREN